MKHQDDPRSMQVLLVEDNPGDVRLTQEVLAECKIATHLSIVGDGVQALAFLRRQAPFEDNLRPDLILLDLNIPKKNGSEVLKEIKADASLRRIPVVILTTSKAEQDIQRSYDLHANCYIHKPVDFESFTKVIRSIEDFWFTRVMLPSEHA